MSLGRVLAAGVQRLRAAAADSSTAAGADLDAEVLLAHALAIPRAQLRSHPEAPADPQRIPHYLALIERRAAGEPLAYLTGWREFWSLTLAVNPAVLVPRPETELLVERALALRAAAEGRVADLGTGSGAVALALASERPRWQITATDLSGAALAVARANAARLAITTLTFRAGSWFEPLGAEAFDLIVSNPPYVAAEDPALASAALAHEPRLALSPGADALSCLRTIVRGAPHHLAAGGWLLLEHGALQGPAVRDELVLAGFRYVRSHRDLGGHERATEGQHGQI
ncbi:MAG TPA: peptide chain release factor N(5)-glutamine methyltransferase [Steroidobacteraceae bacterium]|nr:peptide chain release factor N(5)-glutamine methyltransferase [Steroidobacteraceae bacterium]